MMKRTAIVMCNIFILLAVSCTFDYGESEGSERQNPDLIMKNVEYVRVRSSDPIAKFQAERAERYEKQGVMKLMNFSFEQYGEKGAEVNAVGQAGFASVDIQSGDVVMNNGVRLEVDSEDIILETDHLEWKDEPRTLSSGNEEVTIIQESGTTFTGLALRVEARNRTWEFTGNASGTYVSDDDDEGKVKESKDKTDDEEKGKEREIIAQREDRDPESPVQRPQRPQPEDKDRGEDEIDTSTLK